MCESGKPCPPEGWDEEMPKTFFQSLASTKIDPDSLEYIIVGETNEPGRFATIMQGDRQMLTKMVGSIVLKYIKEFGVGSIRKDLGIEPENNAENEYDPALFQQIQKK